MHHDFIGAGYVQVFEGLCKFFQAYEADSFHRHLALNDDNTIYSAANIHTSFSHLLLQSAAALFINDPVKRCG